MKPFVVIPLSAVLSLASARAGLAARGELELVSNAEPRSAFAGAAQTINVAFHNPRSNVFRGDVILRIHQAGSATAALVGENLWKPLEVLAGQTALESVDLTFPVVNAETLFLLEWIESSRKAVGTTEVIVYPTNLLKDLHTLAGSTSLGLLDPARQLQPALRAQGVGFEDLGSRSLESFPGKLAIVAPLPISQQRGSGLANRVRDLAAKGVAVIWIEPPEDHPARLKPSYCLVPLGAGTVVVVQAALVSDLANNPRSQINLIRLAELALNPEPPALPQSPGKGE